MVVTLIVLVMPHSTGCQYGNKIWEKNNTQMRMNDQSAVFFQSYYTEHKLVSMRVSFGGGEGLFTEMQELLHLQRYKFSSINKFFKLFTHFVILTF